MLSVAEHFLLSILLPIHSSSGTFANFSYQSVLKHDWGSLNRPVERKISSGRNCWSDSTTYCRDASFPQMSRPVGEANFEKLVDPGLQKRRTWQRRRELSI
ncbi:unnamed protein product [Calypogeia fissa]